MKSFKKFVVESIEQVELDEAVEVRHDRYMRSHGKKASGGTGNWMFTHKDMGDVDYNNEKEVYTAPRGKFSDAKKSAQQWAKKHGHSTVYVMEEVELDEAAMQGSKEHLKKLQGMLDKVKPGSVDHSQIRGAIESKFGKQHIPAKHRNVKPDMYEEVELDEKLKASDDMGTWVKDFQKSDAPQFKGKSQKERQKMAIAAKLAAERNEEVELDEAASDKIYAVRTTSRGYVIFGPYDTAREAFSDAGPNLEATLRSNEVSKKIRQKIDRFGQAVMTDGNYKRMVPEEVELDESWSSNMDKASKKAHTDAADKRKKAGPITSKTLKDINDKLGNTKKTNEEVNESNDMKMVRLGQKMLDLAPKEKNDMISNAYSKLGDALTAYGTSFGPKNVKDLEKRTGLNQRIIMDLIKRAQQ